MKDEFFEKILNAVEDRPFITAIARNGEEFETIAQISEGDGGQLRVTLQSDSGPRLGSDDAEATITLPTRSKFRFALSPKDMTAAYGEIKVPLYTADGSRFLYANNEFERVINGKSISLTDPVRAKTLTLWYEGNQSGRLGHQLGPTGRHHIARRFCRHRNSSAWHNRFLHQSRQAGARERSSQMGHRRHPPRSYRQDRPRQTIHQSQDSPSRRQGYNLG